MLQKLLEARPRHMTVELIGSIHELAQVFQPGLRLRRPFHLELRFVSRTRQHLPSDIRHPHVRGIVPEAPQELVKRLQFAQCPPVHQISGQRQLQGFEARHTPFGGQGFNFAPRGLANATAWYIDDAPQT